MAEKFDPYHKWLGIPAEQQPADHYRLLGIGPFESDPDVIEGAADRQMAHVQKHKLGVNSAVSQRILNELAAAKLTLLNPARKAAYDQSLRSTQRPAGRGQISAAAKAVPRAKPVTASSPADAVVDDSLDFVHRETPTATASDHGEVRGAQKRPARKKQAGWKGPGTYATVLLVVAILGVSLMLSVRAKKWQIHLVEGDQPVAQAGSASSQPADRTAKPSITANDPAPDPAPDKKPPKSAPPAEPPSSAKSQPPTTVASSASPATIGPSATVAITPKSPPAAPPAVPAAPSNPSAGTDIRLTPIRILLEGSKHRSSRGLAISPDGRWVFWSGYDSTVEEQAQHKSHPENHLWDLKSDSPPTSLDTQEYITAAFTSDSKHLALMSQNQLLVWDLLGKRVASVKSPLTESGTPAIAPDASCIAAFEGRQPNKAVISSTFDGNVLLNANLPGEALNTTLSPGAKYALVRGRVLLPDQQTGSFRAVLDLQKKGVIPCNLKPLRGDVGWASFSPQGYMALDLRETHEVQVWNLVEDKPVFSVPISGTMANAVTFSADGSRLIVADAPRSLKVWDVKTRQLAQSFSSLDQRYGFIRLQLAGDGKTAIGLALFGSPLSLWSLEPPATSGITSGATATATSSPATPAEAPRPVVATRPVPKIKNKPGERFAPFRVLQNGNPQRFTSTLAFSADGRWVFWAGRQQTFDEQRKSHSTSLSNLWDVRSDGPPTSFDWNKAPLRAAAFTTDNTRLILVFSQEICIWEMATRRLTQIAKSRGGLAQFAPDASCLASAELDTLSVFDPLSGASIARATLPGNANSFALSPGRRYLFVAGSVFRDNKLAGRYKTVVDLQAKAQVPIDYAPAVNASHCCISSQGNLAFYSNDPNALHVWSIPEKKLLFSVPMMIPNEVLTMLFTSDGARLLVSSVDASLRMWDVASGELLREFPLPEQPWFTYMIKLAGDDNTAATHGAGHSVLLWKLETTMDVPPPPIPANAAPPTVVELNVGSGAMAAVAPPAPPIQPPAVQPPPSTVASSTPQVKLSANRMSVPAESDRQSAEKLIQDVFGSDIAKAKKPSEKSTLAEKLQAQAGQSQSAAEKYVLLDQAQKLASEGGDPALFLKSVSALAEAFLVDVAAIALDGGTQLSERQLANKARADLAKGLLPLVDMALQEDHYDTAEKLVELALASARKVKDGALVKQVVERKAGVQELKKQESEISAAREALAKNSDDPDANRTLGKAYCLLKDDWLRGLPLLARSGDNPLQELAAQEIAEPKTPSERMKLADGWYNLGQSAAGHEKTKYLAHAAPWYRKALPELSGITLLKVQKRLEELDGTAAR